jgi:hypothetical protein
MFQSATMDQAPTRPLCDEPTLDQLLAEPIVQQLMRGDRVDESTIRGLVQVVAATRPATRTKDDPGLAIRT